MEQLRQIGEALGSLKALMLFRDEIPINRRQCCLLEEAYALAFETIGDEIKHNLQFKEKNTKWSALESPLRELHRAIREGEQYVKQHLEPKDWWAKAVCLSQNVDCVDFHLHNLFWCVAVVLEAVESAGEISGCDHEGIHRRRLVLSKKYEREWMDPKLFRMKFGKSYLLSLDICGKLDSAPKEDQWILSEAASSEKRSSGKHESQLRDLLLAPKGKVFPGSMLVGSKDYQVRKRLGSGSRYKEVQWMGESFVVKHFFGEIKPVLPEISLLSSVAHPNVMHYMYSFFDEERKEGFLVMELMNKDLAGYIREICSTRRRIPFPLLVAVDIMLQIARGMEYLHSRKIYHGDLNPSNVLVRTRTSSSSSSSQEGYLHVKVTGLGLSSSKSSKGSSIWYAAPEVLAEQQEQPGVAVGARRSEKADVYSFGMICFELLTGKIPFEDDHLQGDKTSKSVRAGERPLFPFPSPKYLTGLTKRCWQADPAQRPGFRSVCRVLRYVKKFLVMNPDHGQPHLPTPSVDVFELETGLSRRLTAESEAPKVSEIPFQMFGYRVMEREKTSVSLKEKSSESGSEGTSVCGEENGFSVMIQDDTFTPPLPRLRLTTHLSLKNGRKASPRKVDNKNSAKTPKGRATIPPQLLSMGGRSLRVKSKSQQSIATVLGTRRSSGHVSDSELQKYRT